MVSLLAESCGNTVLLDGNLNNTNSNIKKLIQSYINENADSLKYLFTLKKIYNLNSKFGDMFAVFNNSEDIQEFLLLNDFDKTDNYLSSKYNCVVNKEEIKYFTKVNEVFIDNLELTKNGITSNYTYYFDDNYIIFYSLQTFGIDFYFHINNEFKILDFKIDNNKFIYILFSHNEETFIYCGHISIPFAELNKENSSFYFNNNIFCIKLDNNIEKILYIYDDYYYFLTSDNNIIKLEFEKKYFFENDGLLYVPLFEEINELRDKYIKIIQYEDLFMYNFINMFGLNDFKIDDNFKISTLTLDIFKNLFKHKFDNTLNGGLNYFDSKSIGYNIDIKDNIAEKDYKILIDNEYLAINGNFFCENLKGKFKIDIYIDHINLFQSSNDKWIFIKKINFNNKKEVYFCNLKFFYKKYEYPNNFIFSFIINNFDEYSFWQKKQYEKFYNISNNENIIQNIIENSDFKDINSFKTNVEFDGRRIVFKNIFNYSSNKYLYNNNTLIVKANEKISKNKIKLFHFNKQYIEKDNNIFFRDNGIFYYSNTDEIIFELINSKGYITEFWIKNQGKILYFKNSNNTVLITNDTKDYDYSINIPYIEDYINISDNEFSDISVDDSDDLSFEKEYSNEILITNKFFVEPLFYKFYLKSDSLENFELFNTSEQKISNYISEPFKDGFIIFFNKKKNEKYYYNIGDSKYNYIAPMKSYENIEINYYFNDNGIIQFDEPIIINSFKLQSTLYINENISIYLYNTIKGTTHRVELSSNEINTKFEIDLEIDKIKLDYSGNQYNSFIFTEESGTSLINNNLISFFKENTNETIYYSNTTEDIDINNLEYSKIKVNTKYNLKNNNLLEDKNGTFSISQPFANSIPIFSNIDFDNYSSSVFTIISSHNDNFYNDNFKNIGNFYKSKNTIENKIVESKNTIFNI